MIFAGFAWCEAMGMARRTPSTLPVSRSLSPTAARQRRLQAARLFYQGVSQAQAPAKWRLVLTGPRLSVQLDHSAGLTSVLFIRCPHVVARVLWPRQSRAGTLDIR